MCVTGESLVMSKGKPDKKINQIVAEAKAGFIKNLDGGSLWPPRGFASLRFFTRSHLLTNFFIRYGYSLFILIFLPATGYH